MINNNITFVMYHYIRELIESKYPRINALNTSEFVHQIDFLSKNYNFLTLEDIRCAIKGEKNFKNGIVLTFDDGYVDHYENVFPILSKLGIQGWFFPPVEAVLRNEVLDVNKIHFVLASIPESMNLVELLLQTIRNFQTEQLIEQQVKDFWANFNLKDAYDPKEITFFKHVLQNFLETSLRNDIVDHLFSRFVDEDASVFSSKLYMDVEKLTEMKNSGMVIGGHGAKHVWLGKVPNLEQEKEITATREFLQNINGNENYVMCYPYGSYNEHTLKVCEKQGFDLGLTTNDGTFDAKTDHSLEIKRKDTNCFPKVKSF